MVLLCMLSLATHIAVRHAHMLQASLVPRPHAAGNDTIVSGDVVVPCDEHAAIAYGADHLVVVDAVEGRACCALSSGLPSVLIPPP